MSQPFESVFTSTSLVPGIQDNVGSQSHHPFGRVDIPEKLRTEYEKRNIRVCVSEGRAKSLVTA